MTRPIIEQSELDKFIGELWLHGWSASEISKRVWKDFGVDKSRCAVMGIVNRRGYIRAPMNPGMRIKQSLQLTRLVPPRPVNATSHPPKVTVVESQIDAPMALLPLISLNRNQCKWICGDPENAVYCGRTADSGSYCVEHRRIVYVPTGKMDMRVPRGG